MENDIYQIRAVYDEQTITVFQAYCNEIALPAIQNQKFVSPFKMDRMTWIKPSFLWMMYRAGWGEKIGQENILSIKIKRDGFDWAVKNGCLSSFYAQFHNSYEDWQTALSSSTVRIQWDPEKDIYSKNLNYKSIQIGLRGTAVEKYINEWIVSIEDITEKCHLIKEIIGRGDMSLAQSMLPVEKKYVTRW